MDDFNFNDFDFNSFFEDDKVEPVEQTQSIRVSHRFGNRNEFRKAKSDFELSEVLDWHFKEGDCFHCFSFGDVEGELYQEKGD